MFFFSFFFKAPLIAGIGAARSPIKTYGNKESLKEAMYKIETDFLYKHFFTNAY